MRHALIAAALSFASAAAIGQPAVKDYEASLCHGLERQLRELSEITTGILDGWGKNNSTQSAQLMEEAERREEIAKRLYAQASCGERPPLEARELYLYVLAAGSKAANTSLTTYLTNHGRKRVRSADFDRLCAIMTQQARAEGLDGKALSPTIGKYCEDLTVFVPSNDLP